MASQASSGAPEQPKQPREPISPAARKRLQKCFEHANKQISQENYDYATELLSQCVLGDPGNFHYLQTFVGNLQKKYGNNKKGSPLAQFKERGARSAVKKALGQGEWDEVLKNGVAVLKVNPWDIPALTAMATACASIAAEGEGGVYTGFAECELLYLKCASDGAVKDPDVWRQLGIALGKRQRFDEAIAFWHKVEQTKPNDEEAQRAIASLAVEKTIVQGKWSDDGEGGKKSSGARPGSQQQAEEDLSPDERLKRRIARQPKDIPAYNELALLYLNADRYPEAEEVYGQAMKVSDNANEWQEKIEDVQIRHLRYKMTLADKRFKEAKDIAAKGEVERLGREIIEKELELYRARCERYPNNLGFRYELGSRQKTKGDYGEAIKEFQLAKNDPRRKGVCLLRLGECFQYIKQYGLAMKHYDEAIQEIPDRDADSKKLALYRAGKLAYGLGELDTAEKRLSALAAYDFAYRDVAALLDKIGKKRNDK